MATGLNRSGLSGIRNMLRRKTMLVRMVLLLALLAAVLAVAGCVQSQAQPRGWSGVAVADGLIFVGSMEGNLVSANISTHNPLWPAVSLEKAKTGGFGCAAPSAAAIYGTPAVSGGLVYVAGYNGRLYAVDSRKGKVEWQYPPEGEAGIKPVVGGAVIAQGKVIFGTSSGKVYAVDAANGAQAWAGPFNTGDKVWSTPVVSGDTIYVGSFDKKLYALNIADGSKRWQFETEGAIVATPLVYNDVVYFGSFDRHFYAVNAADGTLQWRSAVQADKWFWAKAVAHNNTIYAPCLDGKVYVLDAGTGSEVADVLELNSPVSSSPVLVNSSVIVASEAGKVYSIETNTNQLKLLAELGKKQEVIHAPLATSEGVVYVHTQKEETLYALNAETGMTLWKITLK